MDIVERLRQVSNMDLRTGAFLAHTFDTAAQAADTIERLRAALQEIANIEPKSWTTMRAVAALNHEHKATE